LVVGSVSPVPYLKRVVAKKEGIDREIPLDTNTTFGVDTSLWEIKNKYPIFSDKGILSVDGVINIGEFNSISLGTGFVPLIFEKKIIKYDSLDTTNNLPQDSVKGKVIKEKYDFRVAIGGEFSPISFFRFNGSGRYSLIQNSLDRYDFRIRILPSSTVELLTYIIGESGRIDSTNYFSVMFYREVTEWGLSFNGFPSENSSIELDYHLTNVKREGSDHFFSFSASTAHLTGGITLGFGVHGFTLKPYGGFELPFLKFFSLVGNAEYYRVDETDDDNIHFMTIFSGGLKANFYPIGLTIYPKVEYINNRYYKQDLRFLLTSSLLISGFKGSYK
ncbi:MAG: hypothetical protein N2053_13150, partial [Chitinispirillaceae bacterium]|nr:hypothetical protein [Chitinispirillaceae bacterium]